MPFRSFFNMESYMLELKCYISIKFVVHINVTHLINLIKYCRSEQIFDNTVDLYLKS